MLARAAAFHGSTPASSCALRERGHCGSLDSAPAPGAAFHAKLVATQKAAQLSGFPGAMELAGLEPTTSWVRSRLADAKSRWKLPITRAFVRARAAGESAHVDRYTRIPFDSGTLRD